ncbi:MAG TPA: hypothetical protein VGY66_18765 [Gemmataceae bacterium]|jgi:hypothetical protein|nr:hypothetical protein [Gemmataceae bacterium]
MDVLENLLGALVGAWLAPATQGAAQTKFWLSDGRLAQEAEAALQIDARL